MDFILHQFANLIGTPIAKQPEGHKFQSEFPILNATLQLFLNRYDILVLWQI